VPEVFWISVEFVKKALNVSPTCVLPEQLAAEPMFLTILTAVSVSVEPPPVNLACTLTKIGWVVALGVMLGLVASLNSSVVSLSAIAAGFASVKDAPSPVVSPHWSTPEALVDKFRQLVMPEKVTDPENVRPPLNVKAVEVVAPRPVTLARVSASLVVTVSVEPAAVMLVIPDPVIVKLPPSDTKPLPLLPERLRPLLARFALVIPAAPDKFALVRPEIVLLPAAITLLSKVSVLERPTNVSLAAGKLKVVPSVPVKAIELLTPNTLPEAIDKVLPLLAVIVSPFTVVKPGVDEIPSVRAEPPSETAPPPVSGPDVLTVTAEFCKLAFVIPAEPEKLLFVSPITFNAPPETDKPLPVRSVILSLLSRNVPAVMSLLRDDSVRAVPVLAPRPVTLASVSDSAAR